MRTTSRNQTTRRRGHWLRLRLAVAATVGLLALSFPGTAGAAETFGAGHAPHALTYPDGSRYACPGWSGGADGEGNIYIPCGAWIYRLAPDGTYRQAITVPAGHNAARDVAATHTGDAIYFTSGPLGGQDRPNPGVNPNVGKVVKLVRDATGNYVHDPSFDVGPFLLGDNGWWAARNVDVDLAGRVYVTVNAYVFIFDGRTGARVGAFGSDNVYDGTTYREGLEIAQGLAVAPNGKTVYVVEQRFNHVQRWTQDDRGDWHRSRDWALGALGPVSDCVDNATFASPYDIGLDGAGNIYVLDTSCRRIQKYDVATRAYKGHVWRNYPVGYNEHLHHGIAVNWLGTVVVADQGRRYPTTAPQAGCAPDGDLPVFRKLGYNATVRKDRRLTFDLVAEDGCSYVSHVLVTGDAGTNGWIAYRRALSVVVNGDDGARTVNIAVRDPFGRTTTRTITVRLDTTLPVLTPRRRIRMSGAGRYCRRNVRALMRGTGYRLADRCATIRGKVIKIRRRGRTLYVMVRVNRRTARKLYIGARGPVNVWVVSHVRTPTNRKLRKRRHVAVVTALALDPKSQTIMGYPAFRWHVRRR